MNLKANPTTEELSAILSRGDDGRRNVIWVGLDGEVHLEPVPDDENPKHLAQRRAPEMRFRIETLYPGGGRVGPKAMQDTEWVNALLCMLSRHWQLGTRGLVPEA